LVLSLHLRIWAAAALFAAGAHAADNLVYAGTYTTGDSRGIYSYRFDPRTYKFKSLGLAATLDNPTFLVAHPDNRFLYSVSQVKGGSVHSFLIDPKTGALKPVNQASSKGDSPCNLALDRTGRWIAVANYGSGSLAVLPLRRDGGVGDAQAFEQHPGAARVHAVLFSPDNRFLLAADIGLNRIYVYHFNVDTGALTPAATPYLDAPAGVAVRHLAFHPNGRVLYAINETKPSVTGYFYDPQTGALSEIQTLAIVPDSYTGPDAGGEIAINSAGTLVYASNRGQDSMALLVVDPVRFTLSTLEITPLTGRTPRHFALDPAGAFLLVGNQDSGNITAFTVHPHSGQLRPAGRPSTRVDKPACIVIVPAGQ
jgi:6-phosphogluconolactonase